MSASEVPLDLDSITTLSESVDLECKAAQGRDGRGELPQSFWETYSAMANGQGGTILLGVEEKPPRNFRVVGLLDPDRVRQALWDNLHSRKKISVNLLGDSDVRVIEVEGKRVLRVQVPQATRHQKPVHVFENPIGNTYFRRNEGDYRLDKDTVLRMLAERVDDSRDARVLDGYSMADFDAGTVTSYRNRFSVVKPGHVWVDLSPEEFLEKVGAIGVERSSGVKGPTLAGLLMFGRHEAIRDAAPNYMVDYQERPEARAERRWVDRLVPDGTWPGNLYEFFRRTYAKLTTDLKVPFQLQAGQRIDDTPVHEALREALVNTLIHCDFTGRVSVLVVKRPDMFGFRNPGLMRVPLEQALRGGMSDCRNRRLQDMFRYVGFGDHAGSGVPKIYRDWKLEHWRAPALYEIEEPEQTLLELRMESIFPPGAVEHLAGRFGERFKRLPELERIALVTAACESTINHTRLRSITTEHSSDITKALTGLAREGFLRSDGAGRGTVYYLPGTNIARPDDVFERVGIGTSDSSPQDSSSSEGLVVSSEGLPLSSEGLSAILCDFSVRHFGREVLPGKIDQGLMRDLICEICSGQYVSLRMLAEVLKRSPDFLRQSYLNPMVKDRRLEWKYPTTPNHHDQAYRTTQV